MNATQYGVITTAPDADGFGAATFGDVERRVFFQPARFLGPLVVLAGWPVPAVGDGVAIGTGTPQAVALWIIKRGAPAYVYEAAS